VTFGSSDCLRLIFRYQPAEHPIADPTRSVPVPGTQQTSHPPSKTLKTKEIPHRADHHPCVLFPVAFTTTNLNSNT
jgi:hypothetical protein